MGMIGAHGNHCANQALAKADLLIMVGTRAADRAMVDPGEIQRRMATIHIDVDPAEIGKNMQAAIPLVGNVKVILRQILDRGAPVTNSAAWLEQLTDFRRAELNRRFPHREGYVFPGTVLRKLGARLDDDAVVCVDVGQNQIFTCKYLPQKNGRLLTSGGLGTMGYALPAAVGAKVARPDRQTIVVCGDGSFQMAMNELAAIRAADMDIKIVLFRNHTLGLVHQIDYYTGVVFRGYVEGAGDAVLSGGRYDGLIDEMGGAHTPSLGFAMGLERLLLLLDAEGIELPEAEPCDLYIAALGSRAQLEGFALTQKVRSEGFTAECDIVGRSLKAQMKYADKIGARFTMVLGDNELDTGAARLKNMATGEQRDIALGDLISCLYDVRFSAALDGIADMGGDSGAAALLGKMLGSESDQ